MALIDSMLHSASENQRVGAIEDREEAKRVRAENRAQDRLDRQEERGRNNEDADRRWAREQKAVKIGREVEATRLKVANDVEAKIRQDAIATMELQYKMQLLNNK